MKKLILFFLIVQLAFGGVSANTNWDIRPATGSDSVNSGGFVTGATGTDFSQQAAPQFTLTGVTSAGAGNTVLTASAAATMVGNIGLVLSGTNFNTGRYEILSVSVGVSITFGTRADGTSITSGVGASGAINIGGSVATVATPYAAASCGNVYWLKGTLTVTATLTLTCTSGANTNATTFHGFTTTHGDCAVNTTCGTWTTATNSTNLVTLSAQSGYGFYNLTFSNTAGTRGIGFRTSGGPSRDFYFDNCVLDGFSNAVESTFAIDWQLTLSIFNTVIKNSTGAGILTSGPLSINYSYIHDNTGAGVQIQVGGDTSPLTQVVGSTFYKNGANGLFSDVDQNPGTVRALTVNNSNFVDNTGAGIKLGNIAGNEYGCVCTSNILYGNSTYGIDYAAAFYIAENRATNNAFGNNGTAPYHNFTAGINNIVLTGGDPFNGRTSNDFSLNNTTGAGKSLKGSGFAGATTFGTGFIDVGALQSQAAAGGGQVGYAIIQ